VWRNGAGPESSDDDEFQCVSVRVDDEEALIGYYRARFEKMQQLPCKAINKAWVRYVQPKKQAKNPYNGGRKRKRGQEAGKENSDDKESEERGTEGELTKPDWWPKTGCRHREPDHIYKPGTFSSCSEIEWQKANNFSEQLTLLLHILRNLSPHKYHGTDGNAVTANALRQSTKDLPGINATVASWLEEIYWVREQEETYLDGGSGMLSGLWLYVVKWLTPSDGSKIITIRLPTKIPKSKRSKRTNPARKKPRTGTSASQRKPRPDRSSVQASSFTTLPTEHNNKNSHLHSLKRERKSSQQLEDLTLAESTLKAPDHLRFGPTSANALITFPPPTQLQNSHTLLGNSFVASPSHNNPINRDVTEPSEVLGGIPRRNSANNPTFASPSDRTNPNNPFIPPLAQIPQDTNVNHEYLTSIPDTPFQFQHQQPHPPTQNRSNSYPFIPTPAQHQQQHQQQQLQLHTQQFLALQARSQQLPQQLPPQQQQQPDPYRLGQLDMSVWGTQSYSIQGEGEAGQGYNGVAEGGSGEAQAMGYWV
jgi:hypothetical protein